MKKKILLFLWLLFPILGFSQIYYDQLQPIEVEWLKSTGAASGLIPIADGSDGVIWSAAPSSGYDSIRFNSVDAYLRAYLNGVVVDSTSLLQTLTASLISDFDTEVANNAAVAANTAKVTFPGFTDLLTDYSFTDNSTNWNAAYGWGDHSLAEYLTEVNATQVPYSNTSSGLSATDVQAALDELDLAIEAAASGGVVSVNGETGIVTLTTSNITEGTNLYYTEARVAANSAVAANTAKETNATHTGEVTGAEALTVEDGVIDYGNVHTKLKGEITDNDGAWDYSAAGIINAAISTNTTVTFSNLELNKQLKIRLTLSAGATITWPAYVTVTGAELGDGSFKLYADCWNAGSGTEDVLINIIAE